MSVHTTSLKEPVELSLKKRLLRFLAAVGGLVLLVYLAQMPIRYIPAFNHYSTQADKYGLHPGALYYSDVPVTLDGERQTRAAINAVDEAHRRARAERAARDK